MASSIDRPPPSTASIAIATGILAALGGFFLGQASSLGIFGGGKGASSAARVDTKSAAGFKTDSSVGDESDEDDALLELHDFADDTEECKLVLVVRTDLGMTKGKIAAQCSHATLACYKTILRDPSQRNLLQRWERLGQAKVALQVKSEEELELLQAQAVSLGLCARVVQDAGRTQIEAGSATVLGIGPAPKSLVDLVTGQLKLL